MKVQPIEAHAQNEVQMEGAVGAKMRMLIGPDDGAGNFHMRHFELSNGGNTPLHSHAFEHEVLVWSGGGTVHIAGKDQAISRGDVVFVPAGVAHQFRAEAGGGLEFICLIPAPQQCS